MLHSTEAHLGMRDNDFLRVTLPAGREWMPQTHCPQELLYPRCAVYKRVQRWSQAMESKQKGALSLCCWYKTLPTYYTSQIWASGIWSVNTYVLSKDMEVPLDRVEGCSYVWLSSRAEGQAWLSGTTKQITLYISSQQWFQSWTFYSISQGFQTVPRVRKGKCLFPKSLLRGWHSLFYGSNNQNRLPSGYKNTLTAAF